MIRKNRQTLFFSATWPEHVQKVAAGLLKTNPIHLRIGSNNDEGNEGQNRLIVQETIDQEVLVMQNATEKSIELKQRLSLLKKDQGKTIVFFKTKHLCDETARLYGNLPNLPPSAALHGNLPQSERLEVMAAFRSSDIRLLFATDVAARGLDIVDIDLGMYISEKQFARRKFEKIILTIIFLSFVLFFLFCSSHPIRFSNPTRTRGCGRVRPPHWQNRKSGSSRKGGHFLSGTRRCGIGGTLGTNVVAMQCKQHRRH